MSLQKLKSFFSKIQICPTGCLVILASSAVLAFGLYNVHALSGVTEGGILGLILLLQHWFSISPAISGFVLNALCYLFGIRTFGATFLIYSLLASVGFSVSYKICELFPPLWPELANHPLLAAILGALFVGITVGLCVRVGGAPTGDDALAMSLSHLSHVNIRWVYLVMDLIVLALSLTYLPPERVAYSLFSVILSGQLVGLLQKKPAPQSI